MKIFLFLVYLSFNSLKAEGIIVPTEDEVIRYGANNNAARLLWERYRRDLFPFKIKFENTPVDQKIVIVVKNAGNVRFEGEGSRAIEVKINNKVYPALMALPIETSGTSSLTIFSKEFLLSHCEEVKIEIDRDHNALQLGSGVYQNDRASLVAFELGQIPLCI